MKTRQLITLCLLGGVLLAFMGCKSMPTVPVRPPVGFLYTSMKAPLSTNYHQTPVASKRVGEAQAKYLYIPFTYGLVSFSWGDVGLEEAKTMGGIKEVSYADYEVLSILGIYTEFTVYAYGE